MAAPPAAPRAAIAAGDSAAEPSAPKLPRPPKLIAPSAEEAARAKHAQHHRVEGLVGGDREAGDRALAAVAGQLAQQGGVAAGVVGQRARRERQVARLAGLDVVE